MKRWAAIFPIFYLVGLLNGTPVRAAVALQLCRILSGLAPSPTQTASIEFRRLKIATQVLEDFPNATRARGGVMKMGRAWLESLGVQVLPETPGSNEVTLSREGNHPWNQLAKFAHEEMGGSVLSFSAEPGGGRFMSGRLSIGFSEIAEGKADQVVVHELFHGWSEFRSFLKPHALSGSIQNDPQGVKVGYRTLGLDELGSYSGELRFQARGLSAVADVKAIEHMEKTVALLKPLSEVIQRRAAEMEKLFSKSPLPQCSFQVRQREIDGTLRDLMLVTVDLPEGAAWTGVVNDPGLKELAAERLRLRGSTSFPDIQRIAAMGKEVGRRDEVQKQLRENAEKAGALAKNIDRELESLSVALAQAKRDRKAIPEVEAITRRLFRLTNEVLPPK